MNIYKLLQKHGEDKHTNPTTTSYKFKSDVWDFCQQLSDKGLVVELGTHKGQTTNILSYIFNNVITVNLPNHFDDAIKVNHDRTNIEYIGLNLYSLKSDYILTENKVSVFFVDAGHSYDNVLSDINFCLKHNKSSDSYIIFDDYGLIPDVKKSINDNIPYFLEIVRFIGHEPNYDFKNGRVLTDWEGVICKIV